MFNTAAKIRYSGPDAYPSVRAGLGCYGLILSALIAVIFLSACTELKKPESDPFFSETTPPAIQEFRWSNGKFPTTLDPARASAPPETDIVRAIFEGLTEVDPVTLQEISGAAEKWNSTDDLKTWTFHIRKDAVWSNGEPVTAEDFVRSWQRLAQMGERAAHRNLMSNIVGFNKIDAKAPKTRTQNEPDLLLDSLNTSRLPARSGQRVAGPGSQIPANNASPPGQRMASASPALNESVLSGVSAVDGHTLKVDLVLPDKDFPKLVANPVFRPIHSDGRDLEVVENASDLVTNGAFRIATIGSEGLVLEKSPDYWNKSATKLDRVRFVPFENAENALRAYRAGELDAVTNAEFAPLALKLLEPYKDFRRRIHSALNFYEINHLNGPFSDRRVREALAISIERERLTEGELDGATAPASRFLAITRKSEAGLIQDKELARTLLDEAGYRNGENFPVIRLLVNRNDTQQRVARSVAKMWKQNLNLETEIIVKETAEIEEARKSGEFDVIRRGVVLPTADETASFLAIFGSEEVLDGIEKEVDIIIPDFTGTPAPEPSPAAATSRETDESVDYDSGGSFGMILSEDEALYQFHAIPLYFPMSYSLVKPYVTGFEMNSLDAPLLQGVSIDRDWQTKKPVGES